MILNKMHYSVQTAMHDTVRAVRAAKILSYRPLLIFGDMHGMLHKFFYALIIGCRDGNDRKAEQFLHHVHTHRAPIAGKFIHHIQSKNHRNIKLHELHGKIEIPLHITGIHYIDYGFRLVLQDEIP